MKRMSKWWMLPAAVALLAAAFLIYAGTYRHADRGALAALDSGDGVEVTATDYGWHFDGPSDEAALVFYPGAKVEAEAYAPLLRLLAGRGMDACLVKVPFRLAFFGPDRASEAMARHDYPRWYVGGHSLGGVVAANYATAHPDRVAGVILCASYPTKPLPEGMTEVLVYGSEDRVLNLDRVTDGRRFAPARYLEREIAGGNHAWFGSYGLQPGDGAATISPEAQREAAVRAILEGTGE